MVTDLLVEHFPQVMDLKFTSHMEGELDQIETHKVGREKVLTEFWEPFRQSLEVAKVKMQSVKGQETDEKCPLCAKPLVVRFSRKRGSKFLGCSGYPECKYTKPGEGEEARPAAVVTEIACPTCGKPLIQRMGGRGPFLGCSGYPECRTTMNFDAAGKPVLASKPTEHVCDKCGKPMILRDGPRGPFLACTGYPKCRAAKDVDAEGNPIKPIDTGVVCEKCGAPDDGQPRSARALWAAALSKMSQRQTRARRLEGEAKNVDAGAPAKKEMPAVEIADTCPQCGEAMKLRASRRGPFLGCSKYPKCKGTKEVPPEVMEKIGS